MLLGEAAAIDFPPARPLSPVTEVQRCRAISLTESTPAAPRGANGFGIDRHQLNLRLFQERVKLLPSRWSTPTLDNVCRTRASRIPTRIFRDGHEWRCRFRHERAVAHSTDW